MDFFDRLAAKLRFFSLIISGWGNETFISPFSKINAYGEITIGKNCRISEGCVIRVPKTARLIIGDNCDFREFSQVQCREQKTTEFGKQCLIQPFCFINDQVKIGNDAILAPHVVITAARHNFKDQIPINKQGSSTRPIEIGNNVWIGAHAIIIGPCKIGADSIIGAGAIIKQDIPEKSIARTELKLKIEKRR